MSARACACVCEARESGRLSAARRSGAPSRLPRAGSGQSGAPNDRHEDRSPASRPSSQLPATGGPFGLNGWRADAWPTHAGDERPAGAESRDPHSRQHQFTHQQKFQLGKPLFNNSVGLAIHGLRSTGGSFLVWARMWPCSAAEVALILAGGEEVASALLWLSTEPPSGYLPVEIVGGLFDLTKAVLPKHDWRSLHQ